MSFQCTLSPTLSLLLLHLRWKIICKHPPPSNVLSSWTECWHLSSPLYFSASSHCLNQSCRSGFNRVPRSGSAIRIRIQEGKNGAAWHRWCGVAQYGAAWHSMVRRGTVMVRRGTVGSASACCKVRFSARHHREVFPTEHTSYEEMERDLSEWWWINVLYECDWMNECML
jgi:hypothetical protein